MPETSLKIAAAAHHDHDDDDEERNEKIDKVSSKKVEQIGFFLLFKGGPMASIVPLSVTSFQPQPLWPQFFLNELIHFGKCVLM